ncbi:AAA family ATPase [Candidatus Pacearchaeota archaeon]|nr:AAA family ATPase [Candidatus Pacearchaeota archaeon]
MAEKNRLQELETENLLLKEELERMSTPPFMAATVLEIGKKTARVANKPGEDYEVLIDPKMKEKPTIGGRVLLNPQSKAIMGYSEFQANAGDLAVVEEVKGNRAKVSIKGESRLVINAIQGLKSGDEVILDPSASLAMLKTDSKKTKYNLEQIPNAPWSNVAGLEGVIANIRSEIEEPFANPEIFARYGRKPVKGVLLYGPPGCGKTMIAKSIAYSLSKMNPKAKGAGQFINVKGPEILEKWVGNSEGNIRRIYSSAREAAQETGAPVVVFIDEAEAVLKRRGSGISTDIYDSIVPQFLAELDGINGDGNVMTVLATNREDILDSAVVRDGRVDRRIKVPRPSKEGCKKIFQLYLNGKPFLSEGIFRGKADIDELTAEIAESIYDPKNVAYNVINPREKEPIGQFGYQHLISGAMIKGIVDRATGFAIRREIDSKKKSGLVRQDLERAVQEEFGDNLGFTQSLVVDDWESVFGAKGKYYQGLADQGYLVLERSNQDQLNKQGGKTK